MAFTKKWARDFRSYPKCNKEWTVEEDNYLRSTYAKIPRADVAEHLGRSYCAVGIRIIKLNIPRVNHSVSINLSPVDASWLAAAIDGEGCLYLAGEYRYKRKSYHSVIMISNTNLDFVEHAKEIIGAGYIRYLPAGPSKVSNGFNRALYTYHLRGRVVVGAVMKAILPYLIIKRDRAELLIQASEIDDSRFKSRREEAKEDWSRLELLWCLSKRKYGRGQKPVSEFDAIKRWYFL